MAGGTAEMAVGQAPLHIIPMGLEHLPMVLEMERCAYPDPWTLGMYRMELENAHSHLFVLLLEGELAGYAGFWLVLDEAHITRVTIAEAYRGRGHGRTLMTHLMQSAYDLGAALARLEVRESNMPARRMYEGLGFETEGKRLGYYQRTNENAVLMCRRF